MEIIEQFISWKVYDAEIKIIQGVFQILHRQQLGYPPTAVIDFLNAFKQQKQEEGL